MPDKAVFKIESLTEGGYVIYAPDYSQFRETLDMAAKQLVVQAEAWAKALDAELKEQAREEAKAELKNQQGRPSQAPRIITA